MKKQANSTTRKTDPKWNDLGWAWQRKILGWIVTIHTTTHTVNGRYVSYTGKNGTRFGHRQKASLAYIKRFATPMARRLPWV